MSTIFRKPYREDALHVTLTPDQRQALKDAFGTGLTVYDVVEAERTVRTTPNLSLEALVLAVQEARERRNSFK